MNADGRFAGHVVIVTGAAQGLGATYAAALAARGALVAVSDIADPTATVAAIADAGGRAIGVVADVANAESVAELVAQTVDAFGGVDVLVNNAALFATLRRGPSDDITSDEWDRVMAVNVRGTFECVKAVLPAMRARGGGRIINIASTTALSGQVGFLHYATSKGAVIAMTRSLARELGPDNITVNCIAPGLTVSDGVRETYEETRRGAAVLLRALKREQMPDDLVGTVLFLASPESAFMTGQTLVVDGGHIMH